MHISGKNAHNRTDLAVRILVDAGMTLKTVK